MNTDEKLDNGKVLRVLAAYENAYRIMNMATDLSPANNEVTKSLVNLARLAVQPFEPTEVATILNHPDVISRRDRMWNLFRKVEVEMERHDTSTENLTDLTQIRYYENFFKEVTSELQVLEFDKSYPLKKGESLVFVGAGSKPITPILIRQMTSLPVTCIDIDAEAVKLGRGLIAQFGFEDSIRYQQADGGTWNYDSHPVVLVTNHVRDKVGLLRQVLSSATPQRIGIRSALGVCTLLYEPMDVTSISKLGLNFDRIGYPGPPVVNATLVAFR